MAGQEIPEEITVTHLVPAPGTTARVEEVALIWDDRCKPRQRLVTPSGTVLLLALPRGTILQEGDCLWQKESLTVLVRARPEPVLTIPFVDALTLGKVAHHLGNWHRPAQILEDGTVLAQWDPPVQEWCSHHGIPCQREERPFHANVRGHSHSDPH